MAPSKTKHLPTGCEMEEVLSTTSKDRPSFDDPTSNDGLSPPTPPKEQPVLHEGEWNEFIRSVFPPGIEVSYGWTNSFVLQVGEHRREPTEGVTDQSHYLPQDWRRRLDPDVRQGLGYVPIFGERGYIIHTLHTPHCVLLCSRLTRSPPSLPRSLSQSWECSPPTPPVEWGRPTVAPGP